MLLVFFHRNITGYEMAYLVEHTENMLKCTLEALPVEMLTSAFQNNTFTHSTKHFAPCVGSKMKEAIGCQKNMIQHKCGWRVVTNLYHGCHKYIEAARALLPHSRHKHETLPVRIHLQFPPEQKFMECLKPTQIKSDACLPDYKKLCQSSDVHVIKTIRANFDLIEKIILQHPDNTYVIHELRDPRATILSRKNIQLLTGPTLKEEARMHCEKMVTDITQRKALELKYPGIFTEILYEDLADHTLNMAYGLYQHIHKTIPKQVAEWIIKSTSNHDSNPYSTIKAKSRHIAHKWKRNISDSDKNSINKMCKEVFNMTPYTL